MRILPFATFIECSCVLLVAFIDGAVLHHHPQAQSPRRNRPRDAQKDTPPAASRRRTSSRRRRRRIPSAPGRPRRVPEKRRRRGQGGCSGRLPAALCWCWTWCASVVREQDDLGMLHGIVCLSRSISGSADTMMCAVENIKSMRCVTLPMH